MKIYFKPVLLTLLLGLSLALFAGCRTAHGFGEDMQDAGEKIQEQTQ